MAYQDDRGPIHQVRNSGGTLRRGQSKPSPETCSIDVSSTSLSFLWELQRLPMEMKNYSH